jgi:hypothetical protein
VPNSAQKFMPRAVSLCQAGPLRECVKSLKPGATCPWIQQNQPFTATRHRRAYR